MIHQQALVIEIHETSKAGRILGMSSIDEALDAQVALTEEAQLAQEFMSTILPPNIECNAPTIHVLIMDKTDATNLYEYYGTTNHDEKIYEMVYKERN